MASLTTASPVEREPECERQANKEWLIKAINNRNAKYY